MLREGLPRPSSGERARQTSDLTNTGISPGAESRSWTRRCRNAAPGYAKVRSVVAPLRPAGDARVSTVAIGMADPGLWAAVRISDPAATQARRLPHGGATLGSGTQSAAGPGTAGDPVTLRCAAEGR